MKYLKLTIVSLLILLTGCGKSLSKKEVEQYTIKGKDIAMATQKKLGGTLVEKMKDGGVKEAVPFCNTKAIPLIKEMSEKFNVSIKRTSHRLRNPDNKPTEKEILIIEDYSKQLKNKKPLNPVVELDKDGKPHFYAPIIIQKKCLTCHGEIGINVTKVSDSIIESYYPKDLATGFKEGDLRGIWSITFNK
jgi:hypothetical protein